MDAARVALRQKEVESVTLLYRRTRHEMPAFEEEVEAALAEGINMHTLVSPVKIYAREEEIEIAVEEGVKLETLVSPVEIHSKAGHLIDIECIRNKLGDIDSSGRRRPIPVPGTEFKIPLDTLIVAIGEQPDSDCLASMGIKVDKGGKLQIDKETFQTDRPGVFAGGDLISGPTTVADAIAAGKKVAAVIDRYLKGKELKEPPRISLPNVFLEPAVIGEEELEEAVRVKPPTLPVEARKKNFAEVEMSMSVEQASREARRCLRCDLAFTQRENDKAQCVTVEGESA